MSRKAGTPNKKKAEIPTGYKDDKFVVTKDDLLVEAKQEEIPAYLVIQANNIDSLNRIVRAEIACYNYICQGGVSVTNYRGLDGNIVMVYCQAMIRKE